jgi:LmbE family N-acetylglucosaminyl deacetylase
MDQIRTARDIRQLGTILSVWAHPDDETFSAAGIMAAAVRNGQTVVCVTATKGEAGSQDPERWPPQTLGATRSKELTQALQIIGVSEHHWLGYHDGQCERVDPAQAVAKIADLITTINPDTILTFGPEGLTGHPDHQAVSSWVTEAVEAASSPAVIYQVRVDQEKYARFLRQADAKLNIFFNIDKPPLCQGESCDICFTCTDELCTIKCQALAAMPSQMSGMMAAFDSNFITQAFNREVFAKATQAVVK